jgi:hypothetical protein
MYLFTKKTKLKQKKKQKQNLIIFFFSLFFLNIEKTNNFK